MEVRLRIREEIHEKLVELAEAASKRMGMEVDWMMVVEHACRNYIEENNGVGRTIVYKAE